MKTLNSKSSGFVVGSAMADVELDDRQPCFYANIEQATERRDYKWKVGCKFDGKVDEYAFKLSKVGNVNDDEVWNEIVSVDFAIKLIELFRQGGQKSVKKWIQSGRP